MLHELLSEIVTESVAARYFRAKYAGDLVDPERCWRCQSKAGTPLENTRGLSWAEALLMILFRHYGWTVPATARHLGCSPHQVRDFLARVDHADSLIKQAENVGDDDPETCS